MERKAEDDLVKASCTSRVDGEVHSFEDAGIRWSGRTGRFLVLDRSGDLQKLPFAEIARVTLDKAASSGLVHGTLQRVGEADAKEVSIAIREGGTKDGKPLILSSTTLRGGEIPLHQCKVITFSSLAI
jgi:hypothetical protein